MLSTALDVPSTILLKSILDFVRYQASLKVEKGGMPFSASYAPSDEGRSAAHNFQTGLVIPCSVAAILFDLRVAHP
jgi:hypothetical protein